MNVEIISPYIVFLGVAALGAMTDSLLHRGQQLGADKVLIPVKGIRTAAFYISQYLHHFYLGFIAFDIASFITIDIEVGAPWVMSAILFHMIAYFHTVFILREYTLKRAKRPITYLHFVYFPISIRLMIAITLSNKLLIS